MESQAIPHKTDLPLADLPLAELVLDELPLAELVLYELPLAELVLAELPLAELPVDKLPVDKLPLDELPLDEINVDIPFKSVDDVHLKSVPYQRRMFVQPYENGRKKLRKSLEDKKYPKFGQTK